MINCLISHFFNEKIEDVENRPITLYRELINQSINISNLYRGGDFKFESHEDEMKRLRERVAQLRAEGRL